MKNPSRLTTAITLALITNLQATKPPNILFILADDLGYTDVNAFAERATGQSRDRMLNSNSPRTPLSFS